MCMATNVFQKTNCKKLKRSHRHGAAGTSQAIFKYRTEIFFFVRIQKRRNLIRVIMKNNDAENVAADRWRLDCQCLHIFILSWRTCHLLECRLPRLRQCILCLCFSNKLVVLYLWWTSSLEGLHISIENQVTELSNGAKNTHWYWSSSASAIPLSASSCSKLFALRQDSRPTRKMCPCSQLCGCT